MQMFSTCADIVAGSGKWTSSLSAGRAERRRYLHITSIGLCLSLMKMRNQGQSAPYLARSCMILSYSRFWVAVSPRFIALWMRMRMSASWPAIRFASRGAGLEYENDPKPQAARVSGSLMPCAIVRSAGSSVSSA